MFKLTGMILAAIPIVLFLKTIFTGQSKKTSQAVSDFKKQFDYVVWAMLVLTDVELFIRSEALF
jgi:hypothetical protein